MKPFNFFIDNIEKMPPELAMALFGKKPKRIGISYQKYLIPDRIGIQHILTLWLWKWFRNIKWHSKEI